MSSLSPGFLDILSRRGITQPEQVREFLAPPLDRLRSPREFSQMELAVQRLLQANDEGELVAIYADRDVDGLTGLAILGRTLRTLGARLTWGSPIGSRGLDHGIVEALVQEARVLILVDCGAGEKAELEWLAAQGIDVIVADHHRLGTDPPPALAWIHPSPPGRHDDSKGEGSGPVESPCGCVMAFKLAQALWESYLGTSDRDRLDFFLYDHLDLVSLGVLADRMPLTGENRILVWHGLRRLSHSRKAGLSALIRFCRLAPREDAITVHEATWRLIPLLNAAGRQGARRLRPISS